MCLYHFSVARRGTWECKCSYVNSVVQSACVCCGEEAENGFWQTPPERTAMFVFPRDDRVNHRVRVVQSQTDATEHEALQALLENDWDLVETIMMIQRL